MTDRSELERIIADLYKLEETLGDTTSLPLSQDIIQAKVHDLLFRLRIWKENNYDKLLEELNRWNRSKKLLDGV